MAREQGERVPLLAREGEAPRLRVRDDGAAKASRWSRVAMMASGAVALGVVATHARAGVFSGGELAPWRIIALSELASRSWRCLAAPPRGGHGGALGADNNACCHACPKLMRSSKPQRLGRQRSATPRSEQERAHPVRTRPPHRNLLQGPRCTCADRCCSVESNG